MFDRLWWNWWNVSFFFAVFLFFFQHMGEEKMLDFTGDYICVKAKLTFVISSFLWIFPFIRERFTLSNTIKHRDSNNFYGAETRDIVQYFMISYFWGSNFWARIYDWLNKSRCVREHLLANFPFFLFLASAIMVGALGT